MKNVICIAVVLFSAMLLIPLTAMKGIDSTVSVQTLTASVKIPKSSESVTKTFKVCDVNSGEITEIKTEDYIFGVVSSEMPALYENEALKAQAVAAYTYACYRKAENQNKSYDITTDYKLDQSYLSEDKAREKWGDHADEYTEKIKNAISEVDGYMVTYKDCPALTVYHAISAGKTESAENVWGSAYPYLVPVDSAGDKLSPDYISTSTFSIEDIKTKFDGTVQLNDNIDEYFKNIHKTDSGMVKSVEVCGEEITGAKIRTLLNLRSSFFDIDYKESNFTFTVYGYGHGVGMSQNGANYMAKQGSSFKEILATYYPECKIEKIK